MANDPKYTAATARADKLLEPDGSVKTASGTVVSGPSAPGAAAYSAATARADKLLEPDGSIVTSGSGSGGSTPPGGATGQLQYNNAGVFAGTLITTDATNLTFPVNGTLSNTGGGASVSLGGNTLSLNGGSFIDLKNGAYHNLYCNGSASGGGVGIGKPSGIPVTAANGANLDLGQGSAATSGANQLSAQQNFTSNYWNGSASAPDYWTIQNVLGAGTNPTATLTIGHGGGNTGVSSIKFPLASIPVFANNAAAITGGLTAGCHYRTGADPDQLCIVH